MLSVVILVCGVFLASAWSADVGQGGGGTVVNQVGFAQNPIPSGVRLRVTYAFHAHGPLARANSVFVYLFDADGKTVATDDHVPPVQTDWKDLWAGAITYQRSIRIPRGLKDGSYAVVLGMKQGETREDLIPGEGVQEVGPGKRAYTVGTLVIDSAASPPRADTEGERTLDLSEYEMTFSEEFDGPLDVSPWGKDADGRRTRWIAHTPWNGDFGDAKFTDPVEGFPFVIKDGILRIEAKKDASGTWRSGILCSADATGNGFGQKYGYFECRMKMPPGPGVWPAFWLSSIMRPGRTRVVEVDIIEFYGHSQDSYQSVVHVWRPRPHRAFGSAITITRGEAVDDFHDYGCLVDPQWITMYFDGIEVWKCPTPPEHEEPLAVLLNLALGSGWPIDKTPDPSHLHVDHVRVYAKRSAEVTPEVIHDQTPGDDENP